MAYDVDSNWTCPDLRPSNIGSLPLRSDPDSNLPTALTWQETHTEDNPCYHRCVMGTLSMPVYVVSYYAMLVPVVTDRRGCLPFGDPFSKPRHWLGPEKHVRACFSQCQRAIRKCPPPGCFFLAGELWLLTGRLCFQGDAPGPTLIPVNVPESRLSSYISSFLIPAFHTHPAIPLSCSACATKNMGNIARM